MSRGEKLLLGFGLGIPALILLVFLTYWFGVRDTWEVDNYSEITARCESVLRATRHSDDQAAAQAYADLTAFIGDRTIERDSLTDKVESVNLAIAPVHERLEQARRDQEAKVLAETQRRKALTERSASQRPTGTRTSSGYPSGWVHNEHDEGRLRFHNDLQKVQSWDDLNKLESKAYRGEYD
jgi:hypothetical protein